MMMILLTSCGSAANLKTVDNEFYERYDIAKSNLKIYELTYDELYDSTIKRELDGIIFVLREDCEYCKDFMDVFNKTSIQDSKNIYVLETTELTLEQKENLYEDFSLTSVPSTLSFESGKFNAIEVGIPTENELKQTLES